MSYRLVIAKPAESSLRRLDPALLAFVHERLSALAADPGLGRSCVAPVPCYLFGFSLDHRGERWDFAAQYRIAREEDLVVESLGWMVVRG